MSNHNKRPRKPNYPKSATDGHTPLGDAEDTLEKAVVDLISIGLQDGPDTASDEDFETASKDVKDAESETAAAEAEIARRKLEALRKKHGKT